MIKPDRILECVAFKFELDIQMIKGLSRKQELCEARFLFCLITRELTKKTYESIGKYINRDYCTVLHSVNKANDLIDIDPGMKSLYDEIKDEITLEQIM
ncbi:MAG: hypothetical protein LBJ72_08540 [Dysgonamonadaceae bacterium]|jgi:chromosomal replication initiation ATPase DnaA|nr:hypothetical protein [Dysgonamonadaceae bacterium]